ncbi:MAG TPA: acylphosphatase [Caulobacteraceae bacterium]|jgi:acylphosphatase
MPRAALRLVIEGRVQGVGYRWWALGVARTLGVAGWVRNRCDGSVEALALGEEAILTEFIAACGKGPAGAAVGGVRVERADDDGSTTFEQRETA